MTAPAVALRPATPEDRDFFARVYASSRQEELALMPFSDAGKAAFVAQQFHAQSVHYDRYYRNASYEVILVDGEPAGRLVVHRTDERFLVVDIVLLPEFRARGVGTRLLRPLLEEAAASGLPVLVNVERNNRALQLYQRLGFVPVGDDGLYLTLERPPRAAQPNTAS